MKKLLLITAIIFLGSNCFAKKNKSENGKSEKMKYEEYITQYGSNDTSRAIINFFFDKREFCAAGKMSFLPLSAAVTVAVPPIGAGLMAVSSPLFVSGIITRSKYNHKNLVKTLEDYQANHTLPSKIKKKVYQLIEAEEEIYNENLANERIASLRSIRESEENSLITSLDQ